MFRRQSTAPAQLLSPRRRHPSDRTRLGSWWVTVFAVLLGCVVSWQICKVLVTGRQLHPWFFNQAGQETVHWSWLGPKCPSEYRKHQWSDIQSHKKRPYLLGGQQEPECSNCAVDALWSNFCQFRSHGPVCAEWEQQKLIGQLISRAESGALGMKELLTLTPCDLWPWLRGRTLWLVGDSMMQQISKAAICFMYEFWDLNLRPLDNTTKAAGLYQDYLGEFCIEMPEDTRICHLRVNTVANLTERVLPNFSKFGGKLSDILVTNVGVWYSRPWSYEEDMAKFADYYSSHKHELPFLVWRDTAAQHFATPNGDFGARLAIPFVCKPLNVSLQTDNTLVPQDECEPAAAQEILQGGFRNMIANPIISSLGIPIVHTWNLTVPMWEYYHHVAEKGDCTHACHPSTYQVWLYQLHATLTAVVADLQRHSLKSNSKPSA